MCLSCPRHPTHLASPPDPGVPWAPGTGSLLPDDPLVGVLRPVSPQLWGLSVPQEVTASQAPQRPPPPWSPSRQGRFLRGAGQPLLRGEETRADSAPLTCWCPSGMWPAEQPVGVGEATRAGALLHPHDAMLLRVEPAAGGARGATGVGTRRGHGKPTPGRGAEAGCGGEDRPSREARASAAPRPERPSDLPAGPWARGGRRARRRSHPA